MKPSIKIVIFLVVAFIIVGIITFTAKSAVAPVTDISASPTASASPATDKTYTLADVAKHKTENDCWTTVNGSVYDLTPFVHSHPGGVANIIKVCGIDGTSAFTAQHGDDRRPKDELVSLKIGTLTK